MRSIGGNMSPSSPVPEDQTHKYGIVSVGQDFGRGSNRMTGMVEKPPKGTAPSNLHHLRPLHPAARDLQPAGQTQERGAGGEIQLTDSMIDLMKDPGLPRPRIRGDQTYDCGDKIGLLRANVAYALARPELADDACKAVLEASNCAKLTSDPKARCAGL
jgi:UTP--glucose-1-phosphate uridylyltransferase